MFSYEENEKIVNKAVRKCICESLDDGNETDITWWISTTVNKWSGLRSIKEEFSIAIPQMKGVSDAIFVNALRAAFMEYVKVCNCNDDEDELSWMKGISKSGFMDYRNGGFFPIVGIIALLTAQKLEISGLPDISGFYNISTRDKTEKMAWKWFDKNYLNGMEKIDRGIFESFGNNTREYRVSILKVRGKSKVPSLAREITLKFRSEKTEDEVLKVAAKKIKEKFGLDVIDAKVEDKTHSDMLKQAKVTKRDAMNAEQRQADFDEQVARHRASSSARVSRM